MSLTNLSQWQSLHLGAGIPNATRTRWRKLAARFALTALRRATTD